MAEVNWQTVDTVILWENPNSCAIGAIRWLSIGGYVGNLTTQDNDRTIGFGV